MECVLPETLTGALIIKVGKIVKSCRRRANKHVINFTFCKDEHFEVFEARINRATTGTLNKENDLFIRNDQCIYLKPGVNSAQKDFVVLNSENFSTLLLHSYKNHSKSNRGSYVCEVFTFVEIREKSKTGKLV